MTSDRIKLDPTAAAAAAIRRLRSEEHLTFAAIGQRYGLTPLHAWQVCHGLCWTPEKEARRAEACEAKRQKAEARHERQRKARRLREAKAEIIREVRAAWLAGESQPRIAARFEVVKSTVCLYVKGLTRGGWGPRADLDELGAVALPLPAPSRDTRPMLDAPPSSVPAIAVDPAVWGPYQQEFARGSKHGSSKLTEADVVEMRRLKGEGWSYPALARKFGVSRSNVWYIVTGSTWGHAGPPAPQRKDLPKETKTCAACAREFTKPPKRTQEEWAKRRFCCRACMGPA